MGRLTKKKRTRRRNARKAFSKRIRKIYRVNCNKQKFEFLNQNLSENVLVESENEKEDFVVDDLLVDNQLLADIYTYIMEGNVSKASLSILIFSLLK
jgi:hypothetical protein